jgi:hypothetical protein
LGQVHLCLFDLVFYSFDFFCRILPYHLGITVLVLQAEKASWNSIGIFKVSNITGKRRELVPSKPAGDNSDMESEGSDSDEDSEVEELQGSGAPILQAMPCFF